MLFCIDIGLGNFHSVVYLFYISYKHFYKNEYAKNRFVPFYVSAIFECVDDPYWYCEELMLNLANGHARLKRRIRKQNQVLYMKSEIHRVIDVQKVLS